MFPRYKTIGREMRGRRVTSTTANNQASRTPRYATGYTGANMQNRQSYGQNLLSGISNDRSAIFPNSVDRQTERDNNAINQFVTAMNAINPTSVSPFAPAQTPPPYSSAPVPQDQNMLHGMTTGSYSGSNLVTPEQYSGEPQFDQTMQQQFNPYNMFNMALQGYNPNMFSYNGYPTMNYSNYGGYGNPYIDALYRGGY